MVAKHTTGALQSRAMKQFRGLAVLAILGALWASVAEAKVNLSGVAAGTTLAANAGTIWSIFRHPKAKPKEIGQKIKAAIKGTDVKPAPVPVPKGK